MKTSTRFLRLKFGLSFEFSLDFSFLRAFGGADYKAVVKQDVAIAFLVANALARKTVARQFALSAELLNKGCANIEILRHLCARKKPVACVRLR